MLFEKFNISLIKEYIDNLNCNKNTTLIIYVAENSKENLEELREYLNLEEINFFGGIFPGIIYNNRVIREGIVIDTIPVIDTPLLIPDLDSYEEYLNLGSKLSNILEKDNCSAVIFLDGLSGDVEPFLNKLQNVTFGKVNFIGGGTGNDKFEKFPSVFSNEGIFSNAAVIAFTELQSKMNVRHGWEKLMGPYVATRTNKNVIKELNWETAFEIYKSVIEEDSKSNVNTDNFSNVSKSYPFGMYKSYNEDIVRDPVMVNEKGELVCIGVVPENSVLNVLKGVPDNLINAAKSAAESFLIESRKVTNSMVFDCISRYMYLGRNFATELNTIRNTFPYNNKIYGALTIGEIASNGSGIIEFYNKTVVIGILHE